MKTRGRFVKNIDRSARRALGKLGRKLHALRLTAGKRGGGLPDLDITETDVVKRLQTWRNYSLF